MDTSRRVTVASTVLGVGLGVWDSNSNTQNTDVKRFWVQHADTCSQGTEVRWFEMTGSFTLEQLCLFAVGKLKAYFRCVFCMKECVCVCVMVQFVTDHY